MRFRALLTSCVLACLTTAESVGQAKGGPLAAVHPSARTGAALSCQSCHADQAVLTGGTAGLGARRANALELSSAIDRVASDAMQRLADPQDSDKDGISGRVSWVLSLSRRGAVPGRFGWKASVGSLEDQIANALITDMGLRNALLDFADATCTADEPGCIVPQTGPTPEPPLVAPIAQALREGTLPATSPLLHAGFNEAGCAACHVPALEDENGVDVVLFSDLLLHDMGPSLAEPVRVGMALPGEWRTAPLLSLSGRDRFLHDGRAFTIDAAITAHGGEASASVAAFLAMDREQQLDLLTFLNTL